MKMRKTITMMAVIVFAIAAFMIPEETNAASSSIKLGGVEIVKYNDGAWHKYNSKKPSISGWSAGKYKLSKDKGTLYLDGFKYSGKKRGISANGALKIVTTGTNTITTNGARGICLENSNEERKNLTFASNANSTLTVKSTDAYALAVNSLSKGAGTLNITGNADCEGNVSVTGGTLKTTGVLYADGNYSITAGTVAVSGGLDGVDNAAVNGGSTTAGDFGVFGSLSVKGGTLKSNNGISAGSITASGGTMTAVNNIFSQNNMTVSGASVTVQKNGTVVYGSLTLSKGTLTTASQSSEEGIYTEGNFTVSGGTCKASASNGNAIHVLGIFASSGGTVTANNKAVPNSENRATSCFEAKDFKATGGTITATAEGTAGRAISIENDFSAAGGAVTGKTANSDNAWATVVCEKNAEIKNGTVTASGGKCGFQCDGTLKIGGGKLSAKANIGFGAEAKTLIMTDGVLYASSEQNGALRVNNSQVSDDIWLSKPKDGYFNDNKTLIFDQNGERAGEIELKKMSSVSLKQNPQTSYYTEDLFDPEGLIIKLIFADGTENELSYTGDRKDLFTFSKSLSEGLKKSEDRITVAALNNSIDIRITVKDLEAPKASGAADMNSAELKWNSVDGATSYELYRKDSGADESQLIAEISGTEYVDQDLEPGNVYKYKVRAKRLTTSGTVISSPYSNLVSCTTEFSGSPELTVNNNKTNYDLSWTAVYGATEYIVMRKDKGDGEFFKVTTTEELKYTDDTASCYEEYIYRIIPRRVTEDGEWEAAASADVTAVPIAKPSPVIKDPEKAPVNKAIKKVSRIITIGQTAKKMMHISFEKVKGACDYRIEYRKVGDKVWQRKWTGNKTKYTVRNLKKGQLLEFRFAAFRETANGSLERGPYSNMSLRWYMTAKGTVKPAKKSAVVRLKKVKGANGYEVLYSTKASLLLEDNKVRSLSAGKTKVRIRGLKSGKRYYIKYRPVKIYKGKVYRGIITTRKIKVK